MSKVEGGGGVRLTPPFLKASCNYFFWKASRVNRLVFDGLKVDLLAVLVTSALN